MISIFVHKSILYLCNYCLGEVLRNEFAYFTFGNYSQSSFHKSFFALHFHEQYLEFWFSHCIFGTQSFDSLFHLYQFERGKKALYYSLFIILIVRLHIFSFVLYPFIFFYKLTHYVHMWGCVFVSYRIIRTPCISCRLALRLLIETILYEFVLRILTLVMQYCPFYWKR